MGLQPLGGWEGRFGSGRGAGQGQITNEGIKPIELGPRAGLGEAWAGGGDWNIDIPPPSPMPTRRDPRPPARSRPVRPSAKAARQAPEPSPGFLERLASLPRPSLRDLGLASLALAGALVGGTLLGTVWPLKDHSEGLKIDVTPATLAAWPKRSVTVLVIGTDAERIGSNETAAAPKGPANADALLLVRVNPKGPLQVLNLPVELAVMVPGEKEPSRLADLYRSGGVALVADGVRDVLGMEPTEPDRFVVLPRAAMRQIVDGVGGLEISPARTMKYRDKAQNYKIDLQTGLQRLNGNQVEQMLRFRDKDLGESGRRSNHKLVETSLREQWALADQLANLPALISTLRPQVETNLTPAETLSLFAAGLEISQPIQFATLPLLPAHKEFGDLRQLDAKHSQKLWPAPAAKGPTP